MHKIKKILIILVSLIIIITLILVAYRIIESKRIKTDEVEEEHELVILNDNLEKLNVRNKYFIVKRIVLNYYNLLCNIDPEKQELELNNSEEYSEDEKTKIKQNEVMLNKEKLYNYFDGSNKNLTLSNIQSKLGTYNDLYVDINDIEYIESNDLGAYFVKGKLIEKESGEKEDFNLMVVLDGQNSTFNLYTEEDIIEKNLNNFNQDSFKLLGYSKIENRKYNKYSYQLISDEFYCNDLFKSYINRLKYNLDNTYNLLEQNYKNKKFANIEDYKEFIENINVNDILLNSYSIRKNGNKKDIICLDNYGRTYIFYEAYVMNYTVVLDTYTIDLPEFAEKYEASNMQVKTALNIQKIVDALNDKDYKYVYEKLADSFKQNYFNNLESFAQYAENLFGENIKVEYNTFLETSNYCTYDITLKNNSSEFEKTIIMKLQNGTDFVFSFNVD